MSFLFKLWLKLGCRFWQHIVISGEENVDAVLFSNNEEIVNKYSKIKYK